MSEYDYASKRLIIFDLDGTLAESKQSIDREMSRLLRRLLKIKKVAIVSGGKYEQFVLQFLTGLEAPPHELERLFLFPVNGTAFYKFEDGLWQEIYSHLLTPTEKHKIIDAIHTTVKNAGVEMPHKVYGEIIEDRGSQITLSTAGQGAPQEEKAKWDPDQKKRQLLREYLEKLIPEFSISIGGMTSLDVTRKGIDKSFAVAQMTRHLDILKEYMIFIGDGLFEGGNDMVVTTTNIDCIPVRNPEDTKKVIKDILLASEK